MERIDTTTGEMLIEDGGGDLWNKPEQWAGLGAQRVTPEQEAALRRPVSDDEVEILPDNNGKVYLSHPGYRKRLTDAFGVGGWGMRPLTAVIEQGGKLYIQSWQLIAEGRVMGSGTGAAEMGGKMAFDDCVETIKSNALMRCCKELCIAVDLWERGTAEATRDRVGVKVKTEKGIAWRRFDRAPLWNETGIANDSPNRDKYVGKGQAPRQQAPQRPIEGQAGPRAVPAQGMPPAAPAAPVQPFVPAPVVPDGVISAEQLEWLKQECRKQKQDWAGFCTWLANEQAVADPAAMPKAKFRDVALRLRGRVA